MCKCDERIYMLPTVNEVVNFDAYKKVSRKMQEQGFSAQT